MKVGNLSEKKSTPIMLPGQSLAWHGRDGKRKELKDVMPICDLLFLRLAAILASFQSFSTNDFSFDLYSFFCFVSGQTLRHNSNWPSVRMWSSIRTWYP